MSVLNRAANALKHSIFQTVARVANDLGLETYVIGGYVRDALLERGNAKDIDFVSVGSGIDLAKAVAQNLPNRPKVQVFKNYGTAMIQTQGLTLEFVGARRESYAHESRNPSVTPGSLVDDQNRRDFTVNALALSCNLNDFGRLLDPFDGLKHLDQKILITPLDPDTTFNDDPLRMLRAVRFAAQLNFVIEPKTLAAIQRNAHRLSIISQERIVDEVHKILAAPTPSIGLGLMHQTELMSHVFPELIALEGIEEKEGQTHKDNFWHTLEVVDNMARFSDDLWLRWAALLHDIGKAPTKRFDQKNGWTFHGHEFVGAKMVYKLFKRLKMPLNEKMKFVQKMVAMSSRPIVIAQDVTDSAVRRLLFDAGEDLESLMTLCEADITTKNPKRFKRYHENFKRVREKVVEVEQRDHIRNFQPPVSGEEIMETFGLGPSREIGRIKEAIKEAILEGEIPNDYVEAKEFMIKQAAKLGLKPVV
jgi:tRNA nucleotidyltransferase (CCA-adding enzyme)